MIRHNLLRPHHIQYETKEDNYVWVEEHALCPAALHYSPQRLEAVMQLVYIQMMASCYQTHSPGGSTCTYTHYARSADMLKHQLSDGKGVYLHPCIQTAFPLDQNYRQWKQSVQETTRHNSLTTSISQISVLFFQSHSELITSGLFNTNSTGTKLSRHSFTCNVWGRF